MKQFKFKILTEYRKILKMTRKEQQIICTAMQNCRNNFSDKIHDYIWSLKFNILVCIMLLFLVIHVHSLTLFLFFVTHHLLK